MRASGPVRPRRQRRRLLLAPEVAGVVREHRARDQEHDQHLEREAHRDLAGEQPRHQHDQVPTSTIAATNNVT
jgi:hypothetical protein